jgi:hypothetical protein
MGQRIGTLVGFRRVKATPEELADYLRRSHGHRPGVYRVECLDCGKRMWGSGLGIGSHRKACPGRPSAAPARPYLGTGTTPAALRPITRNYLDLSGPTWHMVERTTTADYVGVHALCGATLHDSMFRHTYDGAKGTLCPGCKAAKGWTW